MIEKQALRPLVLGVMFAMLGQAAQAETLSFQQCVERALSQNPDIEVSQAQINQAQAAVRQAEANHMPKVNLSMTGTYTNDALNAFGLKLSQRQATFGDFGAGEFNPADPNVLKIAPRDLNHPGGTGNINTRIEVLVPVYNGGMVESYVRQARAYTRAAQAGDAHARQMLIKNVLMAYQGVHTARAYVKVGEQAQAASEEYVRITERLLQQGMAVKSDVLTAKVHLDDVKLQLARARNAEAAALDQLHLLLGMPLEAPLDVGPELAPLPLQGGLPELQQKAKDGHPALQAMRHQLEGVTANVDVARAGLLPQFNVMLRQDWNDQALGFESSSYTVAGVLSWNAFDAGGTSAAVDRAQAARIETAAKLRQAEEGIQFQVREALRKSREADEAVVARELAAEQADEAQRLVKKRYENGLATMVELLAAQTQLDKAQADLVAARYEQVVQRAELKRAVGLLSVEQL
ncbi:TolC family protein [Thiofaba sp. EF100]|uniref:TolC family protein n=1 Tax=Thiofaba sp. EF100 TaxID=3121274 RepID=UPI003221B370